MRLPADPGFALYVHWPFCRAKCPYCDFNSHVRAAVDHDRWCQGLLAELAHAASLTAGRRLRSIFFGGGTPSLMPPETVAAVIEHAARLWPFEPGVEITLEANPTSAEAGRFRAYAEAGVNRLSLGVQSLDDEALRFLGRQHGAREARTAVELALASVPRVSLDLIYARAGQSVPGWRAELEQALALGTGHISLYQLTIEPGTRFHALWQRGQLPVLEEGAQAELYEATHEALEAAGLRRYEVSNHARPGEECRHNLVYWRYGTYAGIGPGAHGRLERAGARIATVTERVPERWLDRVETLGHGIVSEEAIAPRDQAIEYLLVAMRLAEGVDLDRLGMLAGGPVEEVLDADALAGLVERGLLERDGCRLRATDAGVLALDHLLCRLLR